MPGQLSLFAGKRQRGVRPSPAKEFATHAMLVDVIERWIMPGWEFTHIASGEKRDEKTARKLKRMGVRAGWPDLVFVGHRLLGLELKRRRSKPNEDQVRIGEAFRSAGGEWAVVDNYVDAIETLKRWGVLPGRIEIVNGEIVVRRA